MDEHFSQETKNIIAESRAIALELGYDFISTLHFLLADCKRNHPYSVKSFIFDSDQAFNTFVESQRMGDPLITDDNIPLTVEAEKTIRRAIKLSRRYHEAEVHPYHIFLAASQLKNSWFYTSFKPNDDLYNNLEDYYIKLGPIQPTLNLIERMKRMFLML